MSLHQHDPHHEHEHGSELSEMQLRVRALETILTEKGYIDPKALDFIIDAYETKIGPHIGARVVARAWADPDFKRRLIADATAAVGELGLPARSTHLIAVENTPRLHNIVVCTLCSCYPWAVMDPRGVLADFGVTLPPDTEIRVWDSTAETRYLVVPMRPAGVDDWSEERLASLVTRDCMIGTGLARAPGAAS